MMKLITKEIIISDLTGGEADFLLSPDEALKEQEIMEKIRVALLDVLFRGNIKALHDLDYKRDITLNDGRILTAAWCKNITQQKDGIFLATYAFKNILNKEGLIK